MNIMPVSYHETEKGGKRLIDKHGYIFSKNCESRGLIYWTCLMSRRCDCKARAISQIDSPKYARFTFKVHNHVKDAYLMQKRKTK